ncbi:MAG: indole-3-glycerol phosphate synthase TrpC [Nitrospirota bacterium]
MILQRIVADKREELKDVKARLPLPEVKAMVTDARPPMDFTAALIDPEAVSIIAEVKKASPSKGLIRQDFDPVTIARTYEENGARAVSVLTEKKYFRGDIGYLKWITGSIGIPVLRKDFIFDEYQVYEARANGADAFLLIASILELGRMEDLYLLGKELGMEALAEVHDEYDLDKVLELTFKIIGINNRDLKTFDVDIKNTEYLIEEIPMDRVVVSESGISTKDDLRFLKSVGADAALIGEALMREKDFGKKLRELTSLQAAL